MIPAPEVKAVCYKCGLALNHFANVDYCPNHGQIGRRHQGDVCEAGCNPRLTVSFGGQRHCNACGKDWLA
jgi:hypothetical protein